MFTGLIEEIGTVTNIQHQTGGKKLFIQCKFILDDLEIDDSVAVNGVCLTAVRIEHNGFWIDAVGETLTKSTIGELRTGSKVNLERALKLSDRLGGHIVQGHVNGTGELVKITNRGESYLYEFSVPDNLIKYIIEEGSIAINGVSLTVAQLNQNIIGISVIPHTWQNTTFKFLQTGNKVNIEVDLIAKYLERLTTFNKKNGSGLSIERLKEEGF